MLGVLRSEQGESPYQLAPQPGAAQLPELAERLRSSGLEVHLTSSGDVRPLPPGVDLTVFRIVQEALTNTLKYAGTRSHADVELRYLYDAVEVLVTDDGTATAADRGGAGHGLIGMAERVSVFGGSIDVGPRGEGGFCVCVSLPVESR